MMVKPGRVPPAITLAIRGRFFRDGRVLPGGAVMLAANLALIVVLGQLPGADQAAVDVSVLVARLGSTRYAEREEAAGLLERMGRPAIPALRAARSSPDAEIRTRAATLCNRIESSLLTQPTLVSLDFDNQPLPDVVKRLSAQTGIKLGLVPENAPQWPERRISLHEAAALPFWRAMDRLCEVAQLTFDGMSQGFPSTGREPLFPLLEGGARPVVPTSDSGPFRASLLSVHYQRDLAFSRNAAAPSHGQVVPPPPVQGGTNAPAPAEGPLVNEQFYAQIQVAAEPRLSLSQNGPLKVVEVVDDRGQSLRLETDQGPITQRVSGYFGLATGSTLQLHVPLKRPEIPGHSIRRLRGVLPVMVAARKPDPLVIPLQGAMGKWFQYKEIDISVLDININPDTNQTSIEIIVRSSAPPAAAFAPPDAGGAGAEFLIERPDLHQQQIEVVDTRGRVIAWFQSSFDAEGSRMTLTLTADDRAAPTELRYYGLARAATEVPFEFSDVPMP
jgi:hypothetical protein